MTEKRILMCQNCDKILIGKQRKFCSGKCQIDKWQKEYPEKKKAYNRKWQKEHPDKTKEYKKTHYYKNPEKVKESSKKWSQENPEKVKELNKKWREKNPEYMKEYYQENIEKTKEHNNKYTQKRLKIFHRWKLDLGCYLCNKDIKNGGKIHFHHKNKEKKKFRISMNKYFTALNGNKETIEEIMKCIPLCEKCHHIIEWLIRLKKFDDERLLKMKDLEIKREKIK